MKRIAQLLLFMLLTSSVVQASDKITSTEGIKILRLDKELYSYLSDPNSEKEKTLLQKYANLLPALNQTITGKNESSLSALKDYFSHPELNAIYKYTIEQFTDLNSYENDLLQAVKNTKKELSSTRVPVFSAHVSGFKENVIYVNNTISLSLDKYLGTGYQTYKKYFTPSQIQEMSPRHIVRDFVKAWLMADYIKTEATEGNLLFEIIEHGKLLYALKTILPAMDEKDLLNINDEQYNQYLAQQKRVWNSLVKNNLYSTDKQYISYLFDYKSIEPSSSKVKVPHNIGSWVGLQIVSKYVEETGATLKEILSIDEKTILKKSKYNPK